MTAHPTVSVIIPVYNGERFLAEAIRSVLEQTLTPAEIIVVDDGSTDGSATVAAEHQGVRVLQQSHCGVGTALNLAIGHAGGELLAFLDADDRWLPDKLEKQAAALRADMALDMVFGQARQFHDPGGLTGEMQPGISRCAMLVRRVAFDRVGAFAESPEIHEFVDWYGRAQTAGLRWAIVPDVVFERRIHDDNLGRRTPDAQRQSYLRSVRLSLARRRSHEATTE